MTFPRPVIGDVASLLAHTHALALARGRRTKASGTNLHLHIKRPNDRHATYKHTHALVRALLASRLATADTPTTAIFIYWKTLRACVSGCVCVNVRQPLGGDAEMSLDTRPGAFSIMQYAYQPLGGRTINTLRWRCSFSPHQSRTSP